MIYIYIYTSISGGALFASWKQGIGSVLGRRKYYPPSCLARDLFLSGISRGFPRAALQLPLQRALTHWCPGTSLNKTPGALEILAWPVLSRGSRWSPATSSARAVYGWGLLPLIGACALFGLPAGHFCQGPFDPRELPVRRLPQFADTSDARGLLHAELGISIDEVSSSYPRRDFRAFLQFSRYITHEIWFSFAGWSQQCRAIPRLRGDADSANSCANRAHSIARPVINPGRMWSTRPMCMGQSKPHRDKVNHNAAPWQSQPDWSQWQQSQGNRGRTPSPRQRSKSAKGNKTPKNQGNQGQPMQQPVMPMMPPAPTMMGPNTQMYPQMAYPFPQMNMTGHLPPLPPPDTPWQMSMPAGAKMPAPVLPTPAPAPTTMYVPTMPSMPAAPCTSVPKAPASSMSDPGVRGLMSMMRGRQAELPEDMQKKVQAMLLKYGKQSTKDLHAAVTALDKSREEYDQAVMARSQHHACWKKFLADAVQMWQSYADQFVEQERKLQEQVTGARETFLMAKSELENAKLDAGEVLHPSDDELVEGENETTAGTSTASKLTETMQGLATSLQTYTRKQRLLWKRMRMWPKGLAPHFDQKITTCHKCLAMVHRILARLVEYDSRVCQPEAVAEFWPRATFPSASCHEMDT